MKLLFPEIISKRNTPINFEEKDKDLFSHEFEKLIHQTTFIELRNVYILNNLVFNPISLKFYKKHCVSHPITKKQLLKNLLLLSKKNKIVESAIWIIDENAYGFFHWLTDCLTRLIAVDDYRKNHIVILPEKLRSIQFIEQSLNYLEIKFCYYDVACPVKVKHLLLPSHTAPTGNYNPVLINKLREKFMDSKYIEPTKYIYISRGLAIKRKIINEEEVIALLKEHHIEIHYFENYSFIEQVRLMNQTKCLIGLHGAGLTNMLFMQEGTSVLELRNEGDSLNNCYFSLASDLNLKYYYQLNKGDSKDTHEVNITVDLSLLKKNIELMLL